MDTGGPRVFQFESSPSGWSSQTFKTAGRDRVMLDHMGTDDLETFQTLLDQWAEAIVANDAERIGTFAEPDWVIVGPEGGPGEREPFLAMVASGDLTHSEMTCEVLGSRVYGDVAIVLAHDTNHGTWRDEPFAADEWATDIFLRRPDGWRCAFTALTPNQAAQLNADPT